MSKRTDVLKLLRERKQLESAPLKASFKAELLADIDQQIAVIEGQASLPLQDGSSPPVQGGGGPKGR